MTRCKVCGTTTQNTGTCLCDNCWEMTHRAKGFVVLNNQSNGFCLFSELNPALAHYKDGLSRSELYMLLSVLKGPQ